MPKNTNIVLVRHAEKPSSGASLAPAGAERAHAYVPYFQNYVLQPPNKKSASLQLQYLFASADSANSDRPDLTLLQLSAAIMVAINTKYSDQDYKKAANDILQSSQYDNSNILICWHHGEILALAAALGVNPLKLPSSSSWPSTWPGHVYGWLLQICYDGNGNINTSQTLCINQKLMYDDHHNDPPPRKK